MPRRAWYPRCGGLSRARLCTVSRVKPTDTNKTRGALGTCPVKPWGSAKDRAELREPGGREGRVTGALGPAARLWLRLQPTTAAGPTFSGLGGSEFSDGCSC